MAHPLTDEMIEDLAQFEPDLNEFLKFNRSNDMRAAYDKGADWQLERVIEWLQANLWLHDDETGSIYIKEDFLSDLVINEELIIEDLKKSMRPQEDN